jgi:hypothetical protein
MSFTILAKTCSAISRVGKVLQWRLPSSHQRTIHRRPLGVIVPVPQFRRRGLRAMASPFVHAQAAGVVVSQLFIAGGAFV